MSITIRKTGRRISIHAKGADAQALFEAMCADIDKESPTDAPKPVPGHPKTEVGPEGAATPPNGLNGPQSGHQSEAA